MLRKSAKFVTIFSLLILLIAKVNMSDVYALSVPEFPSCTNPTGTNLRVQYDDGVHGLVGSTAEYRGKDSVYNINGNSDQILQCLCTDKGEGIQTNWWKVSSLNNSEIQTLRDQGWHYIASGALWGLDSAPYMAYNSRYTCNGEVQGVGGPEVLGLAATGDKIQLYSMIGIITGVSFLLLGFLMLRAKK
ncbi:MAG: hypothetical protein ACD_50C00095G0004 [uncultured bacterium]|nr:MAG: hypothetical protein ACD_50C00095G0004 [uncultured bacterium]OGH13845.1 MAG: hypothetical protein A2687_04765 [Candidatus Levybacteria bacterium RIFCSPHIGHO2_01_FULL_38_26]